MTKKFTLVLLLGLLAVTNAAASACDPDEIILLNCQPNSCSEKSVIYGRTYTEEYGCTGKYEVTLLEPISKDAAIELEKKFGEWKINHPKSGIYMVQHSLDHCKKQKVGCESRISLVEISKDPLSSFEQVSKEYAENLNSQISFKLERIWTRCYLATRAWLRTHF